MQAYFAILSHHLSGQIRYENKKGFSVYQKPSTVSVGYLPNTELKDDHSFHLCHVIDTKYVISSAV